MKVRFLVAVAAPIFLTFAPSSPARADLLSTLLPTSFTASPQQVSPNDPVTLQLVLNLNDEASCGCHLIPENFLGGNIVITDGQGNSLTVTPPISIFNTTDTFVFNTSYAQTGDYLATFTGTVSFIEIEDPTPCSPQGCGPLITRIFNNVPVSGSVEVLVTPIPAALPLFATGLGVLGLLGWRRKRKQAA